MRSKKGGPAAEQGDAGLAQMLLVDLVQSCDAGALTGHQRRPTEVWSMGAKAIIGRVAQGLGHLGRIPELLLGNASPVDAGPSQLCTFYQRDPRTVLCGASS